MDFDSRRLLAILALPVIIFWAYGAGYYHAGFTGTQSSQQDRKDLSPPVSQKGATSRGNLSSFIKECDSAPNQSKREFCTEILGTSAAISSAQSTEKGANAALISAIFSAITSVFLLWTILQGRASLALATKANEIVDKNGQAQVRAYCSIESVVLCLGGPPFNGYVPHKLKFRLRNAGLSPALNVSLKLVPKAEDIEGHHSSIEKGDLHPQYTEANELLYLLVPGSVPVPPRSEKIPSAFAEILLKYSDVFGKEHEKKYVFECPYFFIEGEMKMTAKQQILVIT